MQALIDTHAFTHLPITHLYEFVSTVTATTFPAPKQVVLVTVGALTDAGVGFGEGLAGDGSGHPAAVV